MNAVPEQPMSAGRPKRSAWDAYALFLVCVFLLVTVGAALQALSLPIGLLVTEVFLILLPAVIYVRLKRLSLAEGLRWRPIGPGVACRCVILAALGWGTATAIALATSPLSTAILGPPPSRDFLLPRTYAGFGIFLLLGGVLAGICEETLFRGAIQGTLERKGARYAIGVTAVLFAMLHANPWAFFGMVALGVFLGWLTVRTTSTVSAMICHAGNNIVGITVGALLGGWIDRQEAHVTWLALGACAVLFVIALIEFLHHTRGSDRTPSPLAAAPAARPRRAAVVAGAALAIAAVVALYTVLGSYRMTGDRLAPEISRGDLVVVVKTRYVNVDIQPGDIVAFTRDGTTFVRKVGRVDDGSVWVLEEASDGHDLLTEIVRSRIVGKVIHKVRFPGWR